MNPPTLLHQQIVARLLFQVESCTWIIEASEQDISDGEGRPAFVTRVEVTVPQV